MHRLILDVPDGLQVDHIDGDGLNNRRSNIRMCTAAQNRQNSRIQTMRLGIPTTSRFKGVSRNYGKWAVHINGKWVGRYNDEVSAAKAYDAAARQAFGEFAKTNFDP